MDATKNGDKPSFVSTSTRLLSYSNCCQRRLVDHRIALRVTAQPLFGTAGRRGVFAETCHGFAASFQRRMLLVVDSGRCRLLSVAAAVDWGLVSADRVLLNRFVLKF